MSMQFRMVRLTGWRAVTAILAGLASLAVVIVLLTVGFVFIVLPALVVAAIAWRFLPRARIRSMGPASDPSVIEGTYEVAPEDGERKRLEP
ncbi:MAG TPA: hypothetical protein VGM36_04470 [Rhizomicrobium sp.]